MKRRRVNVAMGSGYQDWRGKGSGLRGAWSVGSVGSVGSVKAGFIPKLVITAKAKTASAHQPRSG